MLIERVCACVFWSKFNGMRVAHPKFTPNWGHLHLPVTPTVKPNGACCKCRPTLTEFAHPGPPPHRNVTKDHKNHAPHARCGRTHARTHATRSFKLSEKMSDVSCVWGTHERHLKSSSSLGKHHGNHCESIGTRTTENAGKIANGLASQTVWEILMMWCILWGGSQMNAT